MDAPLGETRVLGLSYAQQRWYQPEVGRFLSEDPVFGDPSSPSSLHAFGYANFNPLNYTDPLGEAARLFRQDIEKLSRSEKEAAAPLVSPFWSLSAAAAALNQLSDEQIVSAVCGEVGCDDGAIACGSPIHRPSVLGQHQTRQRCKGATHMKAASLRNGCPR